jgi:hypothetical protein
MNKTALIAQIAMTLLLFGVGVGVMQEVVATMGIGVSLTLIELLAAVTVLAGAVLLLGILVGVLGGIVRGILGRNNTEHR